MQQPLDLDALNVEEPAASLSPTQLSQHVTLVVASSPRWGHGVERLLWERESYPCMGGRLS